MMLSDLDILQEMESGNIICRPFFKNNLSVASIDLRLGSNLLYESSELPVKFNVDEFGKLTVIKLPLTKIKIDLTKSHFILEPDEFVLAETHELIGVNCRHISAQICDKSTLARLGLSVCFSAGFIDPGNVLKATLELKNNGQCPIELQHGMHICQVKFTYLSTPSSTTYNGKYLNDNNVKSAI